MHLTFLRHGRSLADDQGVHEGRYDSPLTAVGRAQAQSLAAHWQAHPPGFDRLVCSPLVRAHETASVIGAALNLVPHIDPDWMEYDNGPLAGLPRDVALTRYPMPAARGRFEPLTADGGESEAAFHRRAGAALERLITGPGEHVLVVAHGGILNAALHELSRSDRVSFAFGDTGFTTVRVDRSRDRVLVLGVNQRPHLG
ncbi:histidine phosphatase family protein [Deinococcus enclensis]|uniref:2,3-bisphosphoglycerate-dependent phosphoglycerate mutase n=1 Tax=Deinococcus enclensis TaxID=1049582 RepID=A0ABT9MFZ9_9DEIO|nr:histidine phosphatase family protein [Deinococcus enclensis]MDP9765528.1 2,3-bisphosphoglycerate-dependent phosphoglycerate mutase [Deinococcus enclensis]